MNIERINAYWRKPKKMDLDFLKAYVKDREDLTFKDKVYIIEHLVGDYGIYIDYDLEKIIVCDEVNKTVEFGEEYLEAILDEQVDEFYTEIFDEDEDE